MNMWYIHSTETVQENETHKFSKILKYKRIPYFEQTTRPNCSIMGFEGVGLINKGNTQLAFSFGLLGEKYIKCVSNVFTCGAGNYSYKRGEFIL